MTPTLAECPMSRQEPNVKVNSPGRLPQPFFFALRMDILLPIIVARFWSGTSRARADGTLRAVDRERGSDGRDKVRMVQPLNIEPRMSVREPNPRTVTYPIARSFPRVTAFPRRFLVGEADGQITDSLNVRLRVLRRKGSCKQVVREITALPTRYLGI
jgi:hypothetical protein